MEKAEKKAEFDKTAKTAETAEAAEAAEVSAKSEAQKDKKNELKAEPQNGKESESKAGLNPAAEPQVKAQSKNDSETESQKEAQNGKKKADKRITLIHRLGVVFIVLGLLGLMLPLVNNTLLRMNSRINLHNISAEDMERNFENAEYFPIEKIEEIGYVNFWPLLGKSHDDHIIGELVVPSVGIDMPIYSSSSNENLLAGAGLLFPNRRMGVGNYTLAGHRASGKNILMHNLMDVEIGKTIYVTNKRVIYAYKVVSTVQKNTDAVEMLDDSQTEKYENSPIVSLMTCYNGQGNSRWFVIGKIAGFMPYSPEALEKEYEGEGTSFLH
ncbi:MAG: sortase [Clostridiales bacterium]|nr:sortase [Clostridiales bacterium]MDD7432659.1 sortase [Clostridiales bacterium]MDY3060891.1 sortase [Eubacteriales bacterium]